MQEEIHCDDGVAGLVLVLGGLVVDIVLFEDEELGVELVELETGLRVGYFIRYF